MDYINKISKLHKDISITDLILFTLTGIILVVLLSFNEKKVIEFLVSGDKITLYSFILNTFFILIWIVLYILFKRLFTYLFRIAISFYPYTFRSANWPSKWLFQGRILLLDNEKDTLCITDSNSGCILKNRYWKNFEMKFKCKFPKDEKNPILGIIFRATNLSDFFMIQINNDDNDSNYGRRINPHVRVEGVWEPFVGPTLSQSLKPGEFFDVLLKVEGFKSELFINDRKELEWILPTNTDVRISSSDSKDTSYVPKLGFRDIYGMVGFRSYSNEKAIIKSIRIERR